jgi:hypothetical protein
MTVSDQLRRVVVTREGRRNTYTAICADDKCPWKYRGVGCQTTHIRAEEHALKTGHDVMVYEETRTVIGAVALDEGRPNA